METLANMGTYVGTDLLKHHHVVNVGAFGTTKPALTGRPGLECLVDGSFDPNILLTINYPQP